MLFSLKHMVTMHISNMLWYTTTLSFYVAFFVPPWLKAVMLAVKLPQNHSSHAVMEN